MDGKYIEHFLEPWFTLISLGLKTVEGKRNKGKYKDKIIKIDTFGFILKIGDVGTFIVKPKKNIILIG
jgi:hypothetical protein